MEIKRKIVFYKDLKEALKKIKAKRKVLVGGCFDLLHFGHLRFLKKSKEQGDFLIVLLESDEFIKEIKKREPIHNQNQRAEILASLSFVDLVILLPFLKKDNDYFNLIKKIKPSIIAITKGDIRIENKRKQAEKIGAKLLIVTNLIKNFSVTNILNILKNETFFSD